MKVLSKLKYASSDEWVLVEGNVATIGVSDYAQDQLSDVVFVEILAQVGQSLTKGITIATIESVKAAADVILPISGKVIGTNDAIDKIPEKVNSDPYGEAWLIKVELVDRSELDSLMDAGAYETYCESRSH